MSALNLGEGIKTLRKQNNLSQEQLAENLNVSRQAVSKWESNIGYPDISNLILLRDIFGFTLDYLVIDNNTIEVCNFLWGTVGSFIGMGASYILKNTKIKSK